MSTENWFHNLQVITPENRKHLLRKSIGVFPGITDILVCLDRWLILDFPSKKWIIFDLRTHQLFEPIFPVDPYSPRSWVEIDPTGTIEFLWSESSGSGYSIFNLDTGTFRGDYAGSNSIDYPDNLEQINGVLIADARKYIRLSEKNLNWQLSDGVSNSEGFLVNHALGGCVLVTLEEEIHDVSIWYIG